MQYQQEMISGSVAAVVFQNEENGYTVLRLNSDGGETIAVVGLQSPWSPWVNALLSLENGEITAPMAANLRRSCSNG